MPAGRSQPWTPAEHAWSAKGKWFLHASVCMVPPPGAWSMHAWQPACLPMLSLCKCAASACVACCRALCCYTASGAHDTGAGEAPTTCATMYTDCELLMLLAAYEAAAPTRTPRTLALTSADTAS